MHAHTHTHTHTHTQADDPDLRELNLNNHPQLDSNMIEELIRALKDNTNLSTLSMTNVKFSEDHAIVSKHREEGVERRKKRDGKRDIGGESMGHPTSFQSPANQFL